jgi:hypothetical protein
VTAVAIGVRDSREGHCRVAIGCWLVGGHGDRRVRKLGVASPRVGHEEPALLHRLLRSKCRHLFDACSTSGTGLADTAFGRIGQ